MVYVYATQSDLNKYIGKKLSVEEITEALIDMGMDVKGQSEDKDPELKVEITAEKIDMVSPVGIARAIAFYKGIKKELPQYELEKGKNKVIVKKSVAQVRPRTVCVLLKDVPMSEAFLDEMITIQEKIHDSFGRNRKKVAIGVYPTDEFSFPVTYLAEKPENIVFQPLDHGTEINGHEILTVHETGKKFGHLLKGESLYPVFRDAHGKVLSLPPIINSHETGRVEAHHTNLFVEFSGHNLTYLDQTLKVFVTTFLEMGAKAETIQVEYEGSKEVYELDLSSTEDIIDIHDVNTLIGLNLTAKEAEPLLKKAMFGVKKIEGDKITVEIPSFRADVWHDVDIADDVARAYGYNNIEPTYPHISSIGATLVESDFREQCSETMINLGFLEVYSYILTSTEDQFKKFGFEKPDKEYFKLLDSADEGLNMTRVRILPELLRTLNINRKNKYPQKIFENGFTLQVDNQSDTGGSNVLHLCTAIADPKTNYTEIKAALDAFARLNNLELETKPCTMPFMIEGRSAELFYKGKGVGFIGEVHPQVLEHFGIIVPVVAFELILQDIINERKA